MPRTARVAPGGLIYHVLNRGVAGLNLFRSDKDFAAMNRCLIRTMELLPRVQTLAYCIMGTHWHLVLLPERDGDLAHFMMRLTITHVRRWVEHRHRVGAGHVYQGRYKSFACQDDHHLPILCRYVERNPVRAGLVRRAQDWRWSSLGQSALESELRVPLSAWPLAKRRNWLDWVNQPQTPAEEQALRRCVNQGRPFGTERWTNQTMAKLGWHEPLRRGRPRKPK